MAAEVAPKISPREWFPIKELLGLHGLPASKVGLLKRAKKEGGRRRKNGRGYEIHVRSLPEAVRWTLLKREARRLGLPEVASCDLSSSSKASSAHRPPPSKPLAERAEVVFLDQRLDKRTKVALERFQIIQKILDLPPRAKGRTEILKNIAAEHGVSISRLYEWEEKYHLGGLQALMPKVRSDRGRRRVLVSRKWDRATEPLLPPEKRVEIAEKLQHYIRSLWASGATGWRHIQRLASSWLTEESQKAGLPKEIAREACTVPQWAIQRERDYRIVAVAERDAKQIYDKFLPSVRRSASGLRPGDVVFGDVTPIDVPVKRKDGTVAFARAICWMDAATHWIHMTIVLLEKGEGVRREHIAQSFAQMVKEAPFGLPRTLYISTTARSSTGARCSALSPNSPGSAVRWMSSS